MPAALGLAHPRVQENRPINELSHRPDRRGWKPSFVGNLPDTLGVLAYIGFGYVCIASTGASAMRLGKCQWLADHPVLFFGGPFSCRPWPPVLKPLRLFP